MRGFKAKKLRRLAEAMTIGKPLVDYTIQTRRGTDIRVLSPNCTRALYKNLKEGRIA